MKSLVNVSIVKEGTKTNALTMEVSNVVTEAMKERMAEMCMSTEERRLAKVKAEKEARLAKVQELKEIKQRRRAARRKVRLAKAEDRRYFYSATDKDDIAERFAKARITTQINKLKKADDKEREELMKRGPLNLNLQLLGSGMSTREALFKRYDFSHIRYVDRKTVVEKVNEVINASVGLMPTLMMTTDSKTKKLSVSTGIATAGSDRFTRYATEFRRFITKFNIGNSMYTFTKDNNFTDEYVAISADSETIQQYIGDIFYANFEKNAVIVPVYNNNKGVKEYINIYTGRVINKLENYNAYKFIGASASALRPDEGIFGGMLVKVYDPKLKKTRKVSQVINDVCDEMIDYANKEMDEIQASKFFTRHMQYSTKSISLGYLGKVAKLNGIFDTNKLKITNGKVEFKKKGGTFDGIAYMPASVVAKMFNCSYEVALSLCLQARPGSLKVQIEVLEDSTFYTMTEMYNKLNVLEVHGEGDKISLLFDNNSIKANINLECLELEVLKVITKKSSKLSKAILEKAIIGALESDAEAIKNKKDAVVYKRLMDHIIELGKNGMIDDSIDVLIKDFVSVSELNNPSAVIASGDNTIPAVNLGEIKDFALTCVKKINKLSYANKNLIDYLTITTDPGMLFGMKLIEEGEVFAPLYKDIEVKTDKDGRIIAIKYPTMGIKEYYSAKMLSLSEINKRIDEAQCPELLKIAFPKNYEQVFEDTKKSLKTTYSKMSDALVVLPASIRVFNTCAGLDIDTDAMAIVHDEVIVDILFGKEEMIELGKTQKEKANDDDESINLSKETDKGIAERLKTRKGKKFALKANRVLNNRFYNPESDDFFSSIYKIQTKQNGDTIGSISNTNSKIIAVYTCALLGNLAPAVALFEENFGKSTETKAKYEGLSKFTEEKEGKLTYIIDEVIIDEVIAEAKTMKRTKGNLLDLLVDLNRIMRFYQEKTIDAAKTGGSVKVKINTRTIIVSSLVKCEVVQENDYNSTAIPYSIKRNIPELKEIDVIIDGERFTKTQIFVQDPMGIAQDYLIKVANDKITSFDRDYKFLTFQGLEESAFSKLTKFTDSNNEESYYYDMSDALLGVFNSFKQSNPKEVDALFDAKDIYNQLAFDLRNAKESLDSEKDEEMINILNSQFKDKTKRYSNYIEYNLRSLDTGDDATTNALRGMVLIAIGCKSNIQSPLKLNSTSRFAVNIASHYAMCYALNSNKIEANCNVLYCDESLVGQTVKLTYGVSEDMKLIVSDRFHTEGGVAYVDVIKNEDDEIEVVYTKEIDVEAYDENKATLIADVQLKTVVDENGVVVKESNGKDRKVPAGVFGEVLSDLKFDTVRYTKDSLIFSNSKTGEVGIIELKENNKESVRNTDMLLDVDYTIDGGFFYEKKGGKAVLELSK